MGESLSGASAGDAKDGVVKIGVVGCGKISSIYLENCQRYEVTQVHAVADLDPSAARVQAERFGVSKVYTVKELLADADIDIVLNLTIPKAHFEVSRAALYAGKSVYSEKPLAIHRQEGRELLEVARRKGLKLGCAPDTFLGGGLQTCRKAVDDGLIGTPIAATAFMVNHGHEHWHPSPAFYYQQGSGPLFDMGPYYLTALVSLMGPIRRVSASAAVTFAERVVSSQPLSGQVIPVETPTHVAGLLEFASGAIGNLVMSFDVWGSKLPRTEIYGTEGTLSLPDPNTFGGPVSLLRAGEKTWEDLPLTHAHTANSRGIGLADMATLLPTGKPHRASGELAFHVLDAMQGLLEAAELGKRLELKSSCERPSPL